MIYTKKKNLKKKYWGSSTHACGMWDPSSPARDGTHTPALGVWSLNHRLPEKSPTAAAEKSLQSCPTLCDPKDGSPPGSPVPGILQARTLEWAAISFSNS